MVEVFMEASAVAQFDKVRKAEGDKSRSEFLLELLEESDYEFTDSVTNTDHGIEFDNRNEGSRFRPDTA